MQTQTPADGTPLPAKPKPSRFHVFLEWAAADLADNSIRSDSPRLELERQTVVNRLAPYIEELVQLAWRQLQADQNCESSSRSRP